MDWNLSISFNFRVSVVACQIFLIFLQYLYCNNEVIILFLPSEPYNKIKILKYRLPSSSIIILQSWYMILNLIFLHADIYLSIWLEMFVVFVQPRILVTDIRFWILGIFQQVLILVYDLKSFISVPTAWYLCMIYSHRFVSFYVQGVHERGYRN